MTVIEAIKEVICCKPEGLTAMEIYNEIERNNLYKFGAKNPYGIVNGELRRHCVGLDFPTASPAKHFVIAGYRGKKIKFALNLENEQGNGASLRESDTVDFLPEEKIEKAINEHVHQLKQVIMERILQNTPGFFENLVVELLLKMGYGYDDKSGIVTGGPHDGGIDGIISEDNLGLDLIYIQAKRNSAENRVSRKDIQAFIGAMNHIQKGVFITTSSYSKEALDFAKSQQQKSVKLIDGEMLADYMIRYQIGVESVKSFNIYKIDNDFFE